MINSGAVWARTLLSFSGLDSADNKGAEAIEEFPFGVRVGQMGPP
jgi:hypothetical protein